MATNKNALWRLKILDELLSSKEWLTLDELTDKVNQRFIKECRDLGLESECYTVTSRCIRDDISYLDQRSPWVNMGITDNENNGDEDESLIQRGWRHLPNPDNYGKSISLRTYHYRNEGFSIFTPKLTEEEQDLLRAALSIIGQFDGLPLFRGLDRLSKSLDVVPKEKILSVSCNPLSDSTILGELYMMIYSKSVVELSYFRFPEPDHVNSILFHPYILKEYNGRWYVIGAADRDMKIMNFALDRIHSIKMANHKSYHEAPIDLAEWCEDVIGVTVDEKSPVYDILFWVSDRSKYYVASKPLHESQKQHRSDEEKFRSLYPSLKGGWYFSIKCRINYELIRELSSFGAELIVVSPKLIREKIIEIINKMRQTYSTFDI